MNPSACFTVLPELLQHFLGRRLLVKMDKGINVNLQDICTGVCYLSMEHQVHILQLESMILWMLGTFSELVSCII